ncbi:hypothetical protein JCM33774_20170 [Actinophytocola sp. KF-1]
MVRPRWLDPWRGPLGDWFRRKRVGQPGPSDPWLGPRVSGRNQHDRPRRNGSARPPGGLRPPVASVRQATDNGGPLRARLWTTAVPVDNPPAAAATGAGLSVVAGKLVDRGPEAVRLPRVQMGYP